MRLQTNHVDSSADFSSVLSCFPVSFPYLLMMSLKRDLRIYHNGEELERNSWGGGGRREGGAGKCTRKGDGEKEEGEDEEEKLWEEKGEEEHKNHQSVSPVLQRHYQLIR